MIKLQVRERFETQKESFVVDPGRDPSHYKALMEKNRSQILGPCVVTEDGVEDWEPATKRAIADHLLKPAA